jgi:hypothetical protein
MTDLDRRRIDRGEQAHARSKGALPLSRSELVTLRKELHDGITALQSTEDGDIDAIMSMCSDMDRRLREVDDALLALEDK